MNNLDTVYKYAIIKAYEEFKAHTTIEQLLKLKEVVEIISDYFYETEHKLTNDSRDLLNNIDDEIELLEDSVKQEHIESLKASIKELADKKEFDQQYHFLVNELNNLS